MKTVRIDHLTVATPDAHRARATFARFFDLLAAKPTEAGGMALAIGDARIEFVTPAPGSELAAVVAGGGEGMAALCLEVQSLEAAQERLRGAGVSFEIDKSAAGDAIVVEPGAAHGVRLRLVARS